MSDEPLAREREPIERVRAQREREPIEMRAWEAGPTYGYAESREAATAAFAKSWRRE
jgi:hypothetical protein